MMKRRRILFLVLALGLLAGPMGTGCSSKKGGVRKDVSTASLQNIKEICRGCLEYADAHEQRIASGLEDIKSYMAGGAVPESPRKPKDFDGPSYIYVEALAGRKLRETQPLHGHVIVYENPAFCTDEISVGFLDGSVFNMNLPAFQQALADTYKKLSAARP